MAGGWQKDEAESSQPGVSWGHGLELGLAVLGASLIAQLVKDPPAMQETTARCLHWEDPLPKGVSYDLACRTGPRARRASDRTVCACMRVCVRAWPGICEAERGIELLPWQDQWGGMQCVEGG